MKHAHRRLLARLIVGVVLGVLAGGALSACGDDKSSSSDDSVSPTDVLAKAASLLDGTSGVELSLSTKDTPSTKNYLKSATGTIIADPPAFEGTADGTIEGFSAGRIAVVSVGGKFQIDVPIKGFTVFDPKDLCAPDPATLLAPDTGVDSVLTSATDLKKGGSERGGPDNKEVLTSYTGTVPGTAVSQILPCAPGKKFSAKFTVNSDGYLRAAVLTGEFFSGGGNITYSIDIEKYDVKKDITAP